MRKAELGTELDHSSLPSQKVLEEVDIAVQTDSAIFFLFLPEIGAFGSGFIYFRLALTLEAFL